MAKQSGLGDALLVDGYNLSGDTADVKAVQGGLAPIDVTGIDKSAYERIGGVRDGHINWTAHFNPAAAPAAHGVLSTLPATDRQVSYLRGQALGNAAASCVGKQLNYDMTRGQDGRVTFDLNVQANGFGLEWGYQLTPGLRSDTTATNGATFDRQLFDLLLPLASSSALGWQAYLHVTAFTGTSVTCTIKDSADNVTFTALTGGAFTAATGITTQRLASAAGATVRRYVRLETSGTFSAATFVVNFVPNLVAVSF